MIFHAFTLSQSVKTEGKAISTEIVTENCFIRDQLADHSNGLRVRVNRIPGDTTRFPCSVQPGFVISFLSRPTSQYEKC